MTMYDQFGLFINGEWRRAQDGSRSTVSSPVTEKPLGEVPMATRADTEEAIASASKGFAVWRAKQAFEAEIPQAVGVNVSSDVFDVEVGTDKLFASGRVNSVEARRYRRRTAYAHVNLACAGLPYHLHYLL